MTLALLSVRRSAPIPSLGYIVSSRRRSSPRDSPILSHIGRYRESTGFDDSDGNLGTGGERRRRAGPGPLDFDGGEASGEDRGAEAKGRSRLAERQAADRDADVRASLSDRAPAAAAGRAELRPAR